jgi:hypothetical protein
MHGGQGGTRERGGPQLLMVEACVRRTDERGWWILRRVAAAVAASNKGVSVLAPLSAPPAGRWVMLFTCAALPPFVSVGAAVLVVLAPSRSLSVRRRRVMDEGWSRAAASSFSRFLLSRHEMHGCRFIKDADADAARDNSLPLLLALPLWALASRMIRRNSGSARLTTTNWAGQGQRRERDGGRDMTSCELPGGLPQEALKQGPVLRWPRDRWTDITGFSVDVGLVLACPFPGVMGSNGCNRARVGWNPRSAFDSLLQPRARQSLLTASLAHPFAPTRKKRPFPLFF